MPLTGREKTLTVADLMDDHGGWRVDEIEHFLPQDILNQILSLAPPVLNRPEDRVAWNLTKDGEFSTRSAYENLIMQPTMLDCSFLKILWSWPGPERIRILLWKISQGALVTNTFRLRRGLSVESLCPVCSLDNETSLHILRDYPCSSQVWMAVARKSLDQNFFNSNLQEWLSVNLVDRTLYGNVEWRVVFGAGLSSIWLARNEKVFQDKESSVQALSFGVSRHASAIHLSIIASKLAGEPRYQDGHASISWCPPGNEVIKINCDGAVCQIGQVAAVGGVFRNQWGGFLLGYASRMGSSSVLAAELNAVWMGIELSHLKKFKKVVIETDSLRAVRMIRDGCSSIHPLFNLVSDIQRLLSVDGEFSLAHVLREANQLADCFAKFGLSLDFCSRVFYSVPSFAIASLRADSIGTVFPRGC